MFASLSFNPNCSVPKWYQWCLNLRIDDWRNWIIIIYLVKKAPVNVMIHHKSLKLIFCPFSLLMPCHVPRYQSQSFMKLFLNNLFLLWNEGFPIECKLLVLLLFFNPRVFMLTFSKSSWYILATANEYLTHTNTMCRVLVYIFFKRTRPKPNTCLNNRHKRRFFLQPLGHVTCVKPVGEQMMEAKVLVAV